MNTSRFQTLTGRYNKLRVAVVGDFCLDRYLEIDPARKEISIETGLPVHNVVDVRSQPGAAGTILNNLVALGVGEIHVVGFAGEDGEGFELRRALASLPGVNLDGFLQTPLRQTFTYTKPLVVAPGKAPRELNRLDRKNWTPTPPSLQREIAAVVRWLAEKVDAIVLMDQVDLAETGVVTRRVLEAVRVAAAKHPRLLVLADSRRTLRDFPPVCLKMNRAELSRLSRNISLRSRAAVRATAAKLARARGKPCFVTLAEHGILGAWPDGTIEHLPALPTRGKIDIVGAGDAVTANLTAALAAGATLRESLELANAAASIVIHQLGTTGTASVTQLREVFFRRARK
ncbi:MAG: carbohydrate kinase [Pedosphaera sp.]|nr:carbohydrate kinase [Pedosphaera sp.]